MTTVSVSIRIPEELKEQIGVLAGSESKSVSDLMKEALRDRLSKGADPGPTSPTAKACEVPGGDEDKASATMVSLERIERLTERLYESLVRKICRKCSRDADFSHCRECGMEIVVVDQAEEVEQPEPEKVGWLESWLKKGKEDDDDDKPREYFTTT